MTGPVVPAKAQFEGGEVRVQVQLSEAALAAMPDDDDPEREVGIFGKKNVPSEVLPLEDVGHSIGAIAAAMSAAIAKVAPDEAEVEFGVDVGVEAGQLTSLLVKGTGNATLKVRLLWKKGSGSADPGSPTAGG